MCVTYIDIFGRIFACFFLQDFPAGYVRKGMLILSYFLGLPGKPLKIVPSFGYDVSGSVVIEALCYKPEGRRIMSR
jgi:hypothetical protein